MPQASKKAWTTAIGTVIDLDAIPNLHCLKALLAAIDGILTSNISSPGAHFTLLQRPQYRTPKATVKFHPQPQREASKGGLRVLHSSTCRGSCGAPIRRRARKIPQVRNSTGLILLVECPGQSPGHSFNGDPSFDVYLPIRHIAWICDAPKKPAPRLRPAGLHWPRALQSANCSAQVSP